MFKSEKELLRLRHKQLTSCLKEKKHLLEKYENAKKEITKLEKEMHALRKRM